MMSSTENSRQGPDSEKADDGDVEFEETVSLCDLAMQNKSSCTEDDYQYFSKEEEDFFEFFTDLESNTKSIASYSPEKVVFGGKVMSNQGKQKAEKEHSGRRKLVKYDSIGSSGSKRHTKLLLILLGLPPKTQTEKEILVDIRNRQNQHGPSTLFQTDRGNDKKVVHHPRVKKGFWRAVNVASCFGGQFMQSPIH
uniref:Uncharacterized protein n=2 Tax=Daucus carota subsp. sativus TaxID=79200 RepID=A0A162A986_DAUCS